MRGDTGEKAVYRSTKSSESSPAGLDRALDELEALIDDQDFIVGHNILRFDLPQLVAARPRLARFSERLIDTLWLNPLAFPKNPYHHLVKHYQDGRLQAGHKNDPELDAKLVFEVLENQVEAFSSIESDYPDTLLVYHFLATTRPDSDGFDFFFSSLRNASRPDMRRVEAAIRHLLYRKACTVQVEKALEQINSPERGWSFAYALSWITVAGGESVMPPWVCAQFPEASRIVRDLRDTKCNDLGCAWCSEQSDPKKALTRWFGFDSFRPEPADANGIPLQERIVAEAMAGTSVLGILPTGTGKSVCYQVPALSKFERIGALTVVISPLVALMADQVRGLKEGHGVCSCYTINGMLSLPERQAALDAIRLGDAAIVLIAPEQLRNPSVRTALQQREIGYWVLDEAHCVSKWGHDFRPDYRYVSRFIREFSGDEAPAPIICLTATAKPDVVEDIRTHFQTKLSVDLELLDGGSVRTNLKFHVLPTSRGQKSADVMEVLNNHLPKEGRSGAIVYCSTRSATERMSEFLVVQGFEAEHFHAGLTPEIKRDVQGRFSKGETRIIAATNAFGMGIDKPDIRLVIHSDIPGSLENYMQEAGRAGRDRQPATCVLLYAEEDVERQFSLSARSRLDAREIGAVLKAVRNLDKRFKRSGEVVATPGEILREERDQEFERDSATDDTRIKTAVAWLEEASLLTREENRTNIFPSSLKVRTIQEAEEIVGRADITQAHRDKLLAIVRHIIVSPPDAGITTDALSGITGFTGASLRKALADLETLGIATNDTVITVFAHVGVSGQSSQRFQQAIQLERDLIGVLRELAPDLGENDWSPIHLLSLCQLLREQGHEIARPDIVESTLRGIAQDGRDDEGGKGSLRVRKINRATLSVQLQRTWRSLSETADVRRRGAELILNFIIEKIPPRTRGKDIQVEVTLGELLSAITQDVLLRDSISNLSKLLDRALLWLHEQGVITLGRGLTIFRQAITLQVHPGSAKFTQKEFEPLAQHYAEQTVQTHIMAAFARRGLGSIDDALALSRDYFTYEREAFLKRWLPGKTSEIRRQTTPKSWNLIVDGLGNKVQADIVSDDREQTNVLVLAGPGSGKTRVLVHRIAYLIRIRREDPRGILVLAYNRHAAAEIRVRLKSLIGDDAVGVTILTCHALAMRLVGASFLGKAGLQTTEQFDRVVLEAVNLLDGDGLSPEEADAQRGILVQGYRWILVDEYQDIGPEEYELIGAVAGRSKADEDQRLSLFAVGDDDQNIYAFAGASVDFIRRFEQDYKAKPSFLIENYRSSQNIIDAANSVVSKAQSRMKTGHDITINRDRSRHPKGGDLESLDPVAHGRVQVLAAQGGEKAQAVAAVEELVRLSFLVPDWDWKNAAIVARGWRLLDPVRSYCEALGIPVDMANEALPNLWRLREVQSLLDFMRSRPEKLLSVDDLRNFISKQNSNRWWLMISEALGDLGNETGGKPVPAAEAMEWFAEWLRSAKQKPQGLALVSAHRTKGLEFDHVIVLDGGWSSTSKGEDPDAPRRLYYVAMTRARKSLVVMSMGSQNPYLQDLSPNNVLERSIAPNPSSLSQCNRIYKTAEMNEVDLSFAGRLVSTHIAHSAISNASVGDPIELKLDGDTWYILNTEGAALAKMAKRFGPPRIGGLVRGEVAAVIRRNQLDTSEEWRWNLKQETWEVVLPSFVFE